MTASNVVNVPINNESSLPMIMSGDFGWFVAEDGPASSMA
jgi:hypothetical protein